MSPFFPRSARALLALLLSLGLAFAAVAQSQPAGSEPGQADQAQKAAAKADPYAVPEEASVEELVEFIERVQRSQPKANSRQELMKQFRIANRAIVKAADRILAIESDDAAQTKALKAKLASLGSLAQLEEEGAAAELKKLAQELAGDKRPEVAREARLYVLAGRYEELDKNDAEAVNQFVADVSKHLQEGQLDSRQFGLARAATQVLQQLGETDRAAEVCREYAALFEKSDDPQLAMGSAQFMMMAAQLLAQQNKIDEAAELLSDSAEKLAATDNPQAGMFAAQMATGAGNLLQQAGKNDEALRTYQRFAKLLGNHSDPNVANRARALENAVTRLQLIGAPMEIEGTLVGGDKFNWSDYKGKVVLVDFWATWCGPCLAELPNVKETYEKYHDRGFDVVGISLDEERSDVVAFLEKEEIPWPILFGTSADASGWSHPMAEKHAVDAIPLAVLVDRQGKVVSISARGEQLGPLVAELLGPAAKSAAASKSSKAGNAKRSDKPKKPAGRKPPEGRPKKEPAASTP